MVSFQDGSISSNLQRSRLPWAKRLDESISLYCTKLAKLYLAQDSRGMQEPERWIRHTYSAVILQAIATA